MDKVYIRRKAKRKIVKEIARVNKIIAMTFGPSGKKIIINKEGVVPVITDDGYLVSKEVTPFSNPLYHAIEKMNDSVGDGTTTVMLLTCNLIRNVYKCSPFYNLNELKKGIDYTYKNILKKIEKEKVVPTTIDLMNIAKIASKDDEIGYLLGNIFAENGIDSLIKLKEGNLETTTYESRTGYVIKKGVVAKTLDNNVKIEIDYPKVLIMNRGQYIKEEQLNEKNNILIITPNIDEQTLKIIIDKNKSRKYKIYVLRLPITSNDDEALYEDIESYINDDETVNKIIISPKEVILFNHNERRREKRITYLTNIYEKSNAFEKERIRERIALLKAKIVTVYVGGKTELEIKHNFLKLEDAISACYNSIKYGIIIGGGSLLYDLSLEIDTSLPHLSKSFIKGVKIAKETMQIPFKTIIKNSNMKMNNVIKEKKVLGKEFCFDAINKEFVKGKNKGIIDPYYNLKEALEISLSTTNLVLSINAIIKKENKQITNLEYL